MTGAIVIARGGSRRLLRKNARPFCGLPLVAWSVIQAKCSWLVDHVFLSTDDDEIESIGERYGAEIIRRPDWPDADQTSAVRVFAHAIDVIAKRGHEMERFISVLPTSPLRYPDDFDRGIEAHNVSGYRVQAMARNRETLLYQDLAGVACKMHTLDKKRSYLTENAGLCHVCETDWYTWFFDRIARTIGDHDKALDADLDGVYGELVGYSHYVECQPWQCAEVDTLPEFEFAEVLMEHYILKGRGPDVYWKYQEGKNGVV